MIVLDTSVLSVAFRRQARAATEPKPVQVLRRLVVDNRPLLLPGIVLQELLSGLRSAGDSKKLRVLLEGFPLHLATEADHVRAAEISNACRQAGVTCATVDTLIAAIAVGADAFLLTTDRDFADIALHCGLQLYPV